MNISSEVGFYDVMNQNLRPIFTAAHKTIFGKMVTLAIFTVNLSVEFFLALLT